LTRLMLASSLFIENNAKITNLDTLCKLTSVATLLHIVGNNGLLNINGLSNVPDTNQIEIFGNTNLQSLEGLTSLLSPYSITIYNNNARCGTAYNYLTSNFPKSISQFQCCGNGQPEGIEVCDNVNCSMRCNQQCTSIVTDCNCPQNACTAKPWGLCLFNGTCSYDPNAILKPLCGNPLPGYPTVITSSISSTTQLPTTTGTIGSNCTIGPGLILSCKTIGSDIDLTNSKSVNVLTDLTVGASVKLNNTLLNITGCLYLRNNSKLVISKYAFKNHKNTTFIIFKCVVGKFSSITYDEDYNACHQHTFSYDKKTIFC